VALVHAVISAESGYNAAAVSRAGARGLMQLMPDTARRFGVQDIMDPAQNIRGGVAYLRELLTMFNGNLELTLAAYNAGENAVIRNGNRIPQYAETVNYVPKVLDFYSKFKTPRLARNATNNWAQMPAERPGLCPMSFYSAATCSPETCARSSASRWSKVLWRRASSV